jgi:hypothetical protein
MDCKQISALIIWLVFYAAYITKMILLRQQGIKGSILGKNAFEVGLLIDTYGGCHGTYHVPFSDTIRRTISRKSVWR